MKKGFTLVEMLVVIGLFSLIGGSIVALFVSGISSQRKILATQELLDQTSYVLEFMGRALRMAKKDDVGGKVNCLSGDKVNYELTRGNQGIKFRNYKDECQEFYLEGDRLMEARKKGDEATTTLPLTSSALKVNSLKFHLSGAGQGDNLQPRVTIFLEISGRGKNPPTIKIQTTISQRDLDVQY